MEDGAISDRATMPTTGPRSSLRPHRPPNASSGHLGLTESGLEALTTQGPQSVGPNDDQCRLRHHRQLTSAVVISLRGPETLASVAQPSFACDAPRLAGVQPSAQASSPPARACGTSPLCHVAKVEAEEPDARIGHVRICGGCALQAHGCQPSEMTALVRSSQPPGTESCVVNR